MEYTVILRDPRDFTCEADYCKPNTLLDDKKFAVWFDDLEKAKDACVKAGGYCVEDKDFEEVWINPAYIKERERRWQRMLGKKLLPPNPYAKKDVELASMAKRIGGETVKLQPGSDTHINVFDLVEKEEGNER